MLADRALKIALDFVEEYDRFQIVQLLQQSANIAQMRGQGAYQNEANAMAQRCANIERETVFNTYPPDLQQFYLDMPFGYLVPLSLARRVGQGFSGHQSGHIATGELNNLVSAAQILYGNLTGFVTFSRSLGIHPGVIENGHVSLDLMLPNDLFDAQLTKLGEEFKHFDRLFEVMSELVGLERTGPVVYKASSSVFTTVLLFAQDHFSAVLFAYSQIVDAAQKTVQFYKSIIDVKASKAPQNVIKSLEDSKEGVAAGYLEDAVNSIMTLCSSDMNEARRNELKNELSIAARYAVNSAIYGARLRLSIENYTGGDAANVVGTSIAGQPALNLLQSVRQSENSIEGIKSNNAEEIKAITVRSDIVE